MTNLTNGKGWKALKKFSFPLKVLITLVIGFFLIQEVVIHQQADTKMGLLLSNLIEEPASLFLFSLAFALVFVNWGTEAYKWKLLASQVVPTPFSKALMGTLCGLSFGAVFPNRTGEFSGRILYLPPGYRIRGAISSFVGSFAQLTITLVAGLLSLAFVSYQWSSPTLKFGLTFLFTFLAAFLLLLFFQIKWIGRINWGSRRLAKTLAPLKVLRLFETPFLKTVLWISLFRYSIFFLQFVLLLYLFSENFSLLKSLLFVPVSFFSNTLIPSITLAELGIREYVNMTLSEWLKTDALAAVFAGFTLWFMNVAVPSVVGLYFLLRAKLFPSS